MTNKPLRLLIAEDSDDDLELVLRELRRNGYAPDYLRVESEEAFLAALDDDSWEIIIADYSMPSFGAPAILKILQERGLDIPVIVVSGTIGEEVAVGMMVAGANDYVMKDVLVRLPLAIERELRDADVRRAHRTAEAALKQSEERFRLLAENAQDVIYRYEYQPEGHFAYISPAIETVTGYTPQDFYQDVNFIDTIMMTNTESMLESLLYNDAFRFEEPISIQIRTKAGNLIWIEARSTLIVDKDGNRLAIEGIARDITERKQAEIEIRAHSARAEALARMASRLNAHLSLQDVLEEICQETAEALNMRIVNVVLSDRVYQKSFCDQATTEICEQIKQFTIQLQGKLTHLNSVQVMGRAEAQKLLGESFRLPEPIQFFAYSPMYRDGEFIGTVNVFSDDPLRQFDGNDLGLLKGISDQASQAISNARLYDAVINHLGQLQALRAIDLSISGTLHLQGILNLVLTETLSYLKMDAMDILLLDSATQTLKYAAGRGFHTILHQKTRLRFGESYAGHAARTRSVVQVPQLEQEWNGIRLPLLFSREQFVSYCAVPLIAKGEVRGVLEVFNRKPVESNHNWVDFLEAVATQAAIAIDNAALVEELKQSNVELVQAYDAAIEGWGKILETRDEETEGHALRVAELTVWIARAMGASEAELVHVYRGALLHDIGKIGIPDTILLKPGPLNDEEWAIMKTHPEIAYRVLLPLEYLRPALDIPYAHHERWNGSGYPRGLKGEEIPLMARIFAVVDIWDALRSDRPYRPAWSTEKTLVYIQEQSGVQLDPAVVKVFLDILPQFEQAESLYPE
ncbi:MAG: GAF domain-containing protein [Anaerolineaceae bacterium]|nr:GAF domain-containing protein [Anaerolineaceae bacterium]